MAAAAFLVRLILIIFFTFMFGIVPTEFARLPEARILLKENVGKPMQVSRVEPQNYKMLRTLNEGQSEQVLQSNKLNQQEFVSMVLKRRKRGSRFVEIPEMEEAMIEEEERILPIPPPRMTPHVYEVPPEVEEEEDEIIIDISNNGNKEVHVPLHSSANHRHNGKNDNSKKEDEKKKRFKPLWILIALSILALIILLLLMWYFIPRQFMKKVRGQ
ncbi:uncharacterized protein LOC103190215 isoform X3 [Callorhinchus milii]|uniref:uncharacterized protein LOC103190215 isoform X3 n=1 Tax=Callorhinchus milii TaxID=7868 RepID=UPI001C3F7B97|nr:uncharacterized protein LOC103190215 isoform X3 [Callorhinchus milii]